jgi:hypothetical protein
MKFKPSSKCSYLVAIVFIALISGCASKHKIHGTLGGEPGAHKVTQVMSLAPKEEIRNQSHISDRLVSAGVDLASIKNGSVVAGRIYCCGGAGTPEIVNSVFVYIPQNLNVKEGDILEFVEGQGPEGKGKSQLNVAVKVRHESGSGSGTCKWVPENPNLWLRVLYCSWMDDEGWIEGGSLTPEWYKIPGN